MSKFMFHIIICAVSLFAALAIVFAYKIGPVIAVISDTHGVHLGDLFALPLAGLALISAFNALEVASSRR